MKSIKIKRNNHPKNAQIQVPGSKSESNRALVIAANSHQEIQINNLSSARDTVLMQKLLISDDSQLNALDAGTTMRFLLAHYAIRKRERTLTGTERMKQRPIGILVDALITIGADISYLEKDGYPPLQIMPFLTQKSEIVEMRSDVSSQYISAVLMIAPVLASGLDIRLEGKVSSRPYIDMTINLMKQAGVMTKETNVGLKVEHQEYRATTFNIEPDWSGASYWYSLVAMSENLDLSLPGLRFDSFQGDRVIAEIMHTFGVSSTFDGDGLIIKKAHRGHESFSYDFSNCPDLFQTVAVCCAANKVAGEFTGLESLRIKETDRIQALKNELKKLGTTLLEKDSGRWEIIPGESLPLSVTIETYEDHRMAMAFAPLSLLMDVEIDDSEVVDKSYPQFWQELRKIGFEIG